MIVDREEEEMKVLNLLLFYNKVAEFMIIVSDIQFLLCVFFVFCHDKISISYKIYFTHLIKSKLVSRNITVTVNVIINSAIPEIYQRHIKFLFILSQNGIIKTSQKKTT